MSPESRARMKTVMGRALEARGREQHELERELIQEMVSLYGLTRSEALWVTHLNAEGASIDAMYALTHDMLPGLSASVTFCSERAEVARVGAFTMLAATPALALIAAHASAALANRRK